MAPVPPSRLTDLPPLHTRVQDAIAAIPFHFQSTTIIEGFAATDLFALNTVLASSIETQSVQALNRMRGVWDPDGELSNYGFARFPQSFPDVRLINRHDPSSVPLMGIELKGWYLLSKEAAPSYRYVVTPNACADSDLLVVIPWYLTEILSGTPTVLNPFIEQARYAALMRNHYWEHEREARGGNTQIHSPAGVTPYPPPKTPTSDKPSTDSGGNFGRLARVPGLMTDYLASTLATELAGIPAAEWIRFFKTASVPLASPLDGNWPI